MRGALLLIALAGCNAAEIRPQLLVHLDTDAPLALAPGEKLDPAVDRQPALFDTLRLEIVGADGKPSCADCTRYISVHESMFRDLQASFGLVATSAAVLRATLYGAERIDEQGKPLTATAIDVATRLLPYGEDIVDQRIDLPMARAGISPVSGQPDAPQRGAHESSKVASWSGAARTPCMGSPRSDSGVDDGEVCVRGGAYVMGNRKIVGTGIGSDADRLRIVSVAPFFLDSHEYTVRRYRAALAKGFASSASPVAQDPNPNAKQYYCTYTVKPVSDERERHPLTCVSWRLAADLCAVEGRRLPSEAEWEFEAAGRGEGRDYPWGDSLPQCNQAIFARAGAGAFDKNSSKCVQQGQPGGHAAVGSAPGDRSSSGALDLAGGVGEWVRDMWNRQTEPCWAANKLYLNPVCEAPSPADGAMRVIRGGAWTFAEDGLRVARRFYGGEQSLDVSIGFRCAR
jgi:formylglycine-generating enzyme required for sulfatase activity